MWRRPLAQAPLLLGRLEAVVDVVLATPTASRQHAWCSAPTVLWDSREHILRDDDGTVKMRKNVLQIKGACYQGRLPERRDDDDARG